MDVVGDLFPARVIVGRYHEPQRTRERTAVAVDGGGPGIGVDADLADPAVLAFMQDGLPIYCSAKTDEEPTTGGP